MLFTLIPVNKFFLKSSSSQQYAFNFYGFSNYESVEEKWAGSKAHCWNIIFCRLLHFHPFLSFLDSSIFIRLKKIINPTSRPDITIRPAYRTKVLHQSKMEFLVLQGKFDNIWAKITITRPYFDTPDLDSVDRPFKIHSSNPDPNCMHQHRIFENTGSFDNCCKLIQPFEEFREICEISLP